MGFQIDEPNLRSLLDQVKVRHGVWRRVLQAVQVKVVAEIGVFEGGFASKILESCETIERYYMVDPWAKLPDWNKPANTNAERLEEVYAKAMEATAFAAHKVHVLRGTTKDKVDEIPDGTLDFAYVDGDHTLRGITIDLIKLLPKMKPGGIIGGDDFTENPWHHGPKFEPTMVSPFSVFFAEAHDLPFFILPFNQCLIHVNPAAGFSFTDLTGKYGDLSLKNPKVNAEGPKKWRARRKAARLAAAAAPDAESA